MADIAFINLELNQKDFINNVNREIAKLKKIVKRLPKQQQPSLLVRHSANPTTIYNTMVSARRILHIAGHGAYFSHIQSTKSSGEQTFYSLKQFADELVGNNLFLDVDCIVLDTCYSAGIFWRKQLARLVGPGREMIVIGSALKLPFNQAEEFFESFYGALLETGLPRNRSAFLRRVEYAFNSAQAEFIDQNSRFSRLRITHLRG